MDLTDDATLLDSVPEFFGIATMLKARPAEEQGKRFIYVEASREDEDQQGEIVLQKALADSAGFFNKFGNIDLDHKSMPAVAKRYGIEDPESWAVGVPREVRFEKGRTFVKAELYQGDTPLAARANMVWEGMTKLNPPRRYYASVGGAVLAKSIRLGKNGDKIPVVTQTRWSNLALTEQPVNQHLEATASATPFGVFAKSLGGFVFGKSLEAGYATDSAGMTGGQALRMQSLDGAGQKRRSRNYFDLREAISGAIKSGAIPTASAQSIMDWCVQEQGISHDEAAEQVERFLRDVKSELMKRSTRQ